MNEVIKNKQDEIAHLQSEIKELEREDNRAKIQNYRNKYVGRCFSGSLCSAIKIIDISIAADDWFQATYIDVTVPSNYFDNTYRSDREKNYQIILNPTLNIHAEPWIEVKTDTLGFNTETGELNYGRETSEDEFQMRLQFALNYINTIGKMTPDECLTQFNKEDFGED